MQAKLQYEWSVSGLICKKFDQTEDQWNWILTTSHGGSQIDTIL